jgi:endoglucanase
MYELFCSLSALFGPSGCEGDIARALGERARAFTSEVTTDALGNVIAHVPGPGKKLMFAAHMDTPGVIVTHIDDKGFARFAPLGGLEAGPLLGARVRFQNGAQGVICPDGKYDPKEPSLNELYIDLGAAGGILPGDAAVFAGSPALQGGVIIAPHIDNRVSCAVLLKTMELVRAPKHDLYFVFTTQEELWLRGAGPAAFAVTPDCAVAVDAAPAGDTPLCKRHTPLALGGGPAVKFMDESVICHPEMTALLLSAAEAAGITTQREAALDYGTDIGAIHLTRAGVRTGAISISARYLPTPSEMCALADAQACALLAAALA